MADQMGSDKKVRLKEEFRKLDRNGDGTLDFEEVCTLLRKGMSNIGHKEVRALFNAVDKNHNGRIEFNEFVDYIHSVRPDPPGPATYAPNAKAEARHTNAPVAVIESGPGHILPGIGAEGPGPGAYHLDEQPSLRRSRSSGSSIGKGPRLEPLAPRQPSPGPCDYSTDDRVQAHHPKDPRAVIGSGPGHHSLGDLSSASPGPAAYAFDATMGSIKAARATMGHGPGHVSLAAMTDSPGPGAYTVDFTKLAGQRVGARATIGQGPGHKFLGSEHETPGPAAYGLPGKARICGGSLSRARSADFIQTMREFKDSDINHDGKLDFEEVRGLMLKGNPRMKEGDIKAIFAAVDKNGDQRIDFNELVDFLLPDGKAETLLSRRRLKDAFACKLPGPGTYEAALRRDRVRGGGFGRAIRWT